jgi:thioredoxin 1
MLATAKKRRNTMQVKHINSQELKDLIKVSEVPVFVDFYADWCGPCRMLAPVLAELAEKYEGKAVFVKINVDENEDAAMAYGISSIPNVIAFKNGQAVDNQLGFAPEAVLEAFIQRVL